MKRRVAAAAAALGLWAAVAPLVFSWDMGPAVYGSNVLPGVLVVLVGGLGAALRLDEDDDHHSADDLEIAVELMERSCSYLVLLGAWIMLSPFLLGSLLVGSTYLGTVLPGAAVLALALANGYLGWRAE